MPLTYSGGLPPNMDLLQNVLPYLNVRYGGWSPGITVSPDGGPGGDGGDFGPNTTGTTTNGCFEADAFGVQLGGALIFVVGGATWDESVSIHSQNTVLTSPLFSVTKVSTTPYTINPTDNTVLVTTGGSAITVNLPSVASRTGGTKLLIMQTDTSGSVIVTANGSDTIQGSSSVTISSQYGKVGLISDGVSTWYDLGVGGV
jgi:hypothetical protein